MKNLFPFLFLLLASSLTFAQEAIESADKEEDEEAETVHISDSIPNKEILNGFEVSQQAAFPAGETILKKFIENNLVYPEAALKNKKEGTLFLVLTITPTGEVKDINSLNKDSLGYGMEDAAIDLVRKTSGKWLPASHGSQKVASHYRIPIIFNINDYQENLEDREARKAAIAKTIDSLSRKARENEAEPTALEEEVFEIFQVQKMAQFKGGEDAMYRFISDNLQYPPEALENGISGRVVVSFVVEKDGSITNVKIQGKRRVGFGCEEASMDVVKKMDKMWEPAIQRDKEARMRFRLPIRFQTDEGVSPSAKRAAASKGKFLPAEFKGGEENWKRYNTYFLNVPKKVKKKKIKTEVKIAFTVELDGTVTNVRVVSDKRVGYGCEEEAMKLIKRSAYLWDPAYRDGKPEKSRITKTIQFNP